MTKRSLLDRDTQQACLNRINKLTPETQPAWGKMDAAQMLAHCAEVTEVMNGSKPLEGTPFLLKLFKGMIRNAVLNEKPYPRNSRTHPQYLIADQRAFEKEKERLVAALTQMANFTEAERRQLSHPLFGPMTDEELGWASYKHLDYHLSQFGV